MVIGKQKTGRTGKEDFQKKRRGKRSLFVEKSSLKR